MDTHWCLLLLLLISSTSLAQRGCPSEGCDSRGLKCQSDFQLKGTKAKIVWQLDVGNVTEDLMDTSGCVGNNANVVCKVGNKISRGYVSVNATTGKARWYDALLIDPRLPLMDAKGNIRATDGHYLEMLLRNGSYYGTPSTFDYMNDTSSLHYVKDPEMYFVISYRTGGMYTFNDAGKMLASHFIVDLVDDGKISVWKAVTKIVVSAETDPISAYFIARNSITGRYRVYAMNFNELAPYLSERWFLDINPVLPANQTIISGAKLTILGHTLFCALGQSIPSAYIITDERVRGVVRSTLDMYTLSFSSFDFPVGDPRSSGPKGKSPLVWLSTTDDNTEAVVRGWDDYSNTTSFKYNINLSKMFKLQMSIVTSEIMVYGYDPENITLVFGFAGFPVTGKEIPADSGQAGNYLVAMKPRSDGGVDVLWSIFTGLRLSVIGQIIGVHDSMLIASAFTLWGDNDYVLGIQVD